jgi:beta-galactosidase
VLKINSTVETTSKVEVSNKGWAIEGRSEIILCASLFYFRIPMEQWSKRMQQVKDAGYNAIDVYFPWNYHEQERGEWDFTEEKNISRFLEIAKEKGLWVIARPGPYICSEWDGGALPAYLLAIDGLRLRDNNSLFLNEVSHWFAQIMPILKKYELGVQGTVIGIQLDNELDFYNCKDPNGYISALRDLALQYKVSVPLFACAGQGNLYRATGNAEGVMPTCNFYPNDMDADFEDRAVAYYNDLKARNYPLSVTETNRSHFLLRRLLGSGAKLLGPYLQVSGTNFGFNNAINNWGDPLALMTSDYDFHGMITPYGEQRPEYYEGRLFSGLLRTFGSSLALAEPVPSFLKIKTTLQENAGMRYLLKLAGGGYLLSLPNVEGHSGTVSIQGEGSVFPLYTELSVASGSCPILPFELPLDMWGARGILVYSTAELFEVQENHSETILVFCSDGTAEVCFDFHDTVEVISVGVEVHRNGNKFILNSGSAEAKVQLREVDGRMLQVIILQREQTKQLKAIQDDGELQYCAEQKEGFEQEDIKGLNWYLSPAFNERTLSKELLEAGPMYLEKSGINRGFAWYEANLPLAEDNGVVRGIWLQNASDIVSIYANGNYEGTVIPGGSSQYIPFCEGKAELESCELRTEIWGHSNFDDILLPSLQQASMKGLKSVVAVEQDLNWNHNWRFRPCSRSCEENTLPEPSEHHHDCGVIDWGSWIFTGKVETGLYTKELTSSNQSNCSYILHFKGIQVRTVVFVNKLLAGEVSLTDPYFDLTPYIVPGKTAEITLYLERQFRQSAGSISLLKGHQINDWTLYSAEERQLWEDAKESFKVSNQQKGPLEMSPGEVLWLQSEWNEGSEINDRLVQIVGSNAKLTAFYNGRIVSRLWLPCTGDRPVMSGGSQENIYLPGAWLRKGKNRFSLLIEAIQSGHSAVISFVGFKRAYIEGNSGK